MFRAVFLDRDGVLIENRSDYIREWSHVKILPKVLDALSGFQRAGFKIIVVTNQSAVGRGLMTLETAEEINDRLVKTIQEDGGWIDAVYMSARNFSLDLDSSWMIGDAWSDLRAGQSAGLHGLIIVKTGRGSIQLLETQSKEIETFLISEDLFDAFNTIAFLQKSNS